MKQELFAFAIAFLCAGAAAADTTNTGTIGIGNNTTSNYVGPSISNSTKSAINSVYIVQAGFLNASWVAQAGDSARIDAPFGGSYVNVTAPLLSITTNGGNVNMSDMFHILNQSVSLGDGN